MWRWTITWPPTCWAACSMTRVGWPATRTWPPMRWPCCARGNSSTGGPTLGARTIAAAITPRGWPPTRCSPGLRTARARRRSRSPPIRRAPRPWTRTGRAKRREDRYRERMPAAVGVVLAAGMGTRVGADGNKAYLPLAGRSMVSWSVDAVARTQEIDRTVLVFRRGERDLAERMLHTELGWATVELVEGADTRHGSELNVLRYLASDIESGDVDVVLIHDRSEEHTSELQS